MSDVTSLSSEFGFEFEVEVGKSRTRFSRIEGEQDHSVFDLQTQRRIDVLEELVRNHDRRLSIQGGDADRIAKLESGLRDLMADFMRYSEELGDLRGQVESVKASSESAIASMRKDIFCELDRVRSNTSTSIPSPVAVKPSQSGGSGTGRVSSLSKCKPKDDRPAAALWKPVRPAGRIDLSKSPFKLVVFGDSGVGKTALMYCISNQDLPAPLAPTIGVDFFTFPLTVRGKQIKVQWWDTAGIERFRTNALPLASRAQVLLVMYRIDSRTSFDTVPSWVSDVRKLAGRKASVLIVAWDTKTSRRVVSESEGQTLAERVSAYFVELYLDRPLIEKALVDFFKAASS
jgi:small GTP-binding protein